MGLRQAGGGVERASVELMAIFGRKIDKFAFFVQESSLAQLLEFPNLVETPIISFSFDPEGVQVYY